MRFFLIFLFVSLHSPGFVWSQSFFSTEAIRGKLSGRADKSKKYNQLDNSFEGVVSRITDSESIWVHLEKKRDFIRWTYKLSKSNLDVDRQEVRIWLRYVSPKRSISRGKEYNDWFKKKVAYEMGQHFHNRRVRVTYNLLKKVYRLEGMLWTGDVNVNTWLVRNGWSFYLIEDGDSPFHQDFVAAEQYARQHKLGLWKAVDDTK
ncbi:MAG: thermonuclease family protein [SAR324 cluster bacterium]|nr:thermonuclease family protein [SAR324 cluster bacterium]